LWHIHQNLDHIIVILIEVIRIVARRSIIIGRIACECIFNNRFFALDSRAYEGGSLDSRTKELAGLSASLVLRCDDCISYHVIRCKELGVTDEEMFEIFNVGLIVGGSIVIPHLRRAVDLLDELAHEEEAPNSE
jgi:AhpD family alkylhydroperoxidase